MDTGLIAIVVRKLDQGETLIPACTIVNNTSSEHVFKNLINPFILAISLRMIRRASNQLGSERKLQFLPEACNELCPSIRNDCLSDTMQTNNLSR
jgi:hypothetical protein